MACVVPGCKSGHGNQSLLPPGVRIHRFPAHPRWREVWAKAVPRTNWQPKKHSRICSLHFDDDDYTDERTDRNVFRTRNGPEKLLVPRLKPFAIPHLFPSAPVRRNSPDLINEPVSQDSQECVNDSI